VLARGVRSFVGLGRHCYAYAHRYVVPQLDAHGYLYGLGLALVASLVGPNFDGYVFFYLGAVVYFRAFWKRGGSTVRDVPRSGVGRLLPRRWVGRLPARGHARERLGEVDRG
jgi:hypothetical protein